MCECGIQKNWVHSVGCKQISLCITVGHSIFSGQRMDARMRLIPLNNTIEEDKDLNEKEEQDVGENKVGYW